ncbi:MAG TPA: sigma-70 family RNA polymerase sigma factor [Pirellulales bacterium]|nr:sigma-70 family RNA polymerase sigma factor [Pirellulales bacterium]
MNPPPLEHLLELLSEGDSQAIEHVFVNVAPGLRTLVRRQISGALRTKFDSEDVVLSVWTDLLDGFRDGRWHFETAAQLRAFLITATRRRLIDRVRQHRRAIELEQPFGPEEDGRQLASGVAAPSEEARGNELWRQLLALCPPAHRELLTLKRQGLPLAEIAARTGLHASSVRRILYDLAKRLAAAQRETLDADEAPESGDLAERAAPERELR